VSESSKTITDLGEFGLIADVTARFPASARALVGIGDDAAVLTAPDGRVVVTMDLLVEGRHFRRDWSSPADIGAKAAAQNLADLAAMGADPVAVLVGLAAPGTTPLAWVRQLADGLAAECAAAGAAVVGGDTTSAEQVTLAVAALGDLAGRPPVTRAGARPGDLLAVAGVLGHAAAGVALLRAGLAEPAELIAAHRRPRPPYQAGPGAARLGATAMIDVSDGLVADAGHLAKASGVLIDIDSTRLPCAPVLTEAAAALGVAGPREWLLTGGEDHALAATFPEGTVLPGEWSVVGRAREAPGRPGVLVDGRAFARPGGWDHFRP
jgi:thiamine-monophosphate kinase